jgi:hypothetical protein
LEALDDEVSHDLLTSENTKYGDYLGIRSGFLTYLPKGKPVDAPYASRNRVRGKPAKVAKKFCAHEHTDAAYEAFHNLLISRGFSIKSLEILKGDDIVNAYNTWYDKRAQSSGMSSCMVGAQPRKFGLYSQNPHRVRLLVLWDTFKGQRVIVCRGLLWKTDKGIFLDRLYGSDAGKTFVKQYAKKKKWLTWAGWAYKSDEPGYTTVTVTDIHRPEDGSLPYLDTFYGRGDRTSFEGEALCP